MDRRALGSVGENAAAEMLQWKGYRILARNYRCQMGEIDIVAAKGGSLCFVEVKTRSGYGYGRPCEAVDRKKQGRIRKSAMYYLKELERKGFVPGRITFDVVEIVAEHMENAF